MMTVKQDVDIKKTNETVWDFARSFQAMIEEYGEHFGKNCISCLYSIYAHITLANLIQIVTTKMSVREAEFNERTECLKRSLERLRKVRGHVRDLIAGNEELRRAFDNAPRSQEYDGQTFPEQDQEFILELMKEFKYERTALSEVQGDNLDCGEFASPASTSPETSVYTSVSDCQQDCHVKIVKVTNVYKVSYLRNFIKQKRLRRASKQALLKKKMEDTKKLIENWQRTLNMVINSKLAMLEVDPNRIEIASQKAMGDYKPHRESSDSDSELSWNHNSFLNYAYYEEAPGAAMSGEYYAPRDYTDTKYQPDLGEQEGPKLPSKLFVITEATSSQLAIEEAKSDAGDDWDTHDMLAM
ncbi:unnamed protein product, partial [Iphiclides podalirius]